MPDPQPFAVYLLYPAPTQPVRLFNLTADELAYIAGMQEARKPKPPPVPADGVIVPSGSDVTAALKAAKPGGKVYLLCGGAYAPILDPDVKPNGVTLLAWSDGKSKARPVISSRGTSGLKLWAVDNFTVQGIAFVGDGTARDTASAGLDLWGVKGFTASDCEVTGHRMGVTLMPAVKRGCEDITIADSYIHDNSPQQDGVDGSGIFAGGVDGLTIADNVVERNGWSDTYGGSFRNHGCYIRGDSSSATVTGNIFARNSSHGLQARSGGVVSGNTFTDNPIHMSFGLVNGGGPIHIGGVTGKVTGNTFAGTRLLDGAARGWGLEIGNALDVEVSGNTFASDAPYDQRSGAMAAAIKLDVCKLDASYPDRNKVIGIKRIVIANNAISWPFGRVWVNPALGFAVGETGGTTCNVAQVKADAAARLQAAVRGMVK